MIHGDDFFVVARAAGRRYFEEVIRRAYEVKVSIAGPAPEDAKELRLLGRVLTYRADGVTLETDPRLHESVVQQLGLVEAKAVGTPGCCPRGDAPDVNLRDRRVRAEPIEDEDSDAEDTPLAEPRLTQYAPLAARSNCLAMDRPDLMYSVKELMRFLSKPTERHWTGLKRAARYRIGTPRLVARYPWGR